MQSRDESPSPKQAEDSGPESLEVAPLHKISPTRGLLALCLLTVCWLVVMGSAATSYQSGQSHLRIIDAHGGLIGVIAQQGQQRMVNLVLGVAARELAKGELKALTVPKKYKKLLKLRSDGSPSGKKRAMQVYLLKRLTRGRLNRVNYDARVPMAKFDELVAGAGVKAYPMNIYTVEIPGADHTRLVAVTDQKRRRLALVPVHGSPVSVLP